MQDQQAFCSTELAQSGAKVNNPRDKDQSDMTQIKSLMLKLHALIQIKAGNIKTTYRKIICALTTSESCRLLTCNLFIVTFVLCQHTQEMRVFVCCGI